MFSIRQFNCHYALRILVREVIIIGSSIDIYFLVGNWAHNASLKIDRNWSMTDNPFKSLVHFINNSPKVQVKMWRKRQIQIRTRLVNLHNYYLKIKASFCYVVLY